MSRPSAPRPSVVRMPPVDPADLTDSQRVVAGIGASNVIRTLVRHPDLLNAWLGLGTKLLFSERLSPRQRELVVLRVAWRTTAAYEWGGHAIAAQAAGMTVAEIRAPPALLTSAPPERPPMPADDSPGYGDVSGTWQVIFHHPTGNQHLTLVLSVSEGGVSGSVVNAAAGITVTITQGHVDGSHFSFEAPLTAPVEVAITYAGVVHGDTLRGEVTIAGGGSFPVDGHRA